MEYEFLVDGEIHKVSLETKDGKIVAALKSGRLELDNLLLSTQEVSLLANGKSYRALLAGQGKRIYVAVGASHFCLEVPEQDHADRFKEEPSGKAEGIIKAPMPGTVIKVNVSEGAEVNPGDSLAVVEAMKMEHEMRAASRAIVAKVHVKAGQRVDAFQPLVELKIIEG
jgi:biotin carboxyl carrier protein